MSSVREVVLSRSPLSSTRAGEPDPARRIRSWVGAYWLLVLTACVMAALAEVTSVRLGLPIREPDSFLGPEWAQEVVFVLVAFAADVVPRTLWRARLRVRRVPAEARRLVREDWNIRRAAAVLVGITCFFVTYVSYRNLKGFLPFVRSNTYDGALHRLDQILLLGHDPALVLQDLLGRGVSASSWRWSTSSSSRWCRSP